MTEIDTLERPVEEAPEPRTHSQSLSWNDDGFGSPQKIEVVWSDSFLGLRQAIRDRRWTRDICSPYDCTGLMFAQGCKVLHVAKTDAGHSAVLLTTSSYDV